MQDETTVMADNLIHEIEEDIKREKLETLWKEYGGYLIAALVLAVLLTALVSGWRSWNARVNVTQTTALINALDRETPSEQITAVNEVVTGLRPDHQATAHLTAAGLALREENAEAALAHYNAIAQNADASDLFRELALLMAVRLETDMAAADGTGIDAPALTARLAPLRNNPGTPWRWHAYLQSALIAAHVSGDYAQARSYLAEITMQEGLPPSLMERAQALTHIYSLQDTSAADTQTTTDEAEG